ncbi:MAG: hypothetical protein AB7O38_08055 [Pirellulaceae bacterium]
MASVTTIELLNRLVVILSRSLAMYLHFATPSWHRGDDRARFVLAQIVADQQSLVERLGELILESNGTVSAGAFPMEFTGYHDLSFDFLRKKLIEGQRTTIAVIQRCVDGLSTAPFAKALAEEALGSAKAHLELLQELDQPVAGSRA